MSRWFRHYAGMMRDEKLVSAAVKSRQPVERVVWVWGAILESASEINDGGRYEFDCGEAAYFLRCEEEHILCIVQALHDLGRLHQEAVVKWSERQYLSDTSTERVRKHREKKTGGTASAAGNAQPDTGNTNETFQQRYVTPPEAEADTEAYTEKKLEKESRAAACVEIGKRVTDLMGVTNDPRWLGNWSTVSVWLAQGFDAELDIMPTVAATVERLKRTGKAMPGSLKYFTRAIEENHKARQATGESPAQKATREFYSARKGTPQYRAWLAHYRRQGRRMAFYEAQDILTVPTEFPPDMEKAA